MLCLMPKNSINMSRLIVVWFSKTWHRLHSSIQSTVENQKKNNITIAFCRYFVWLTTQKKNEDKGLGKIIDIIILFPRLFSQNRKNIEIISKWNRKRVERISKNVERMSKECRKDIERTSKEYRKNVERISKGYQKDI